MPPIVHRVAGAVLLALGVTATCAADDPLRSACDDKSVQQILIAAPAQAMLDARAVWLNRQLLRWPQVEPNGYFRLYHSASGQIVARGGSVVSGADGRLALDISSAALADDLSKRFRWVAGGVQLRVRDTDLPRLDQLHRGQLVLVREDPRGRVQQSTRVQIAGALDDLYAAATRVDTLGAHPSSERSTLRLWAPTARRVALCLYRDSTAPAHAVLPMRRDAATGVWLGKRAGNLGGQYYSYLVDVFVPGLGVLRNRVTDPYSLSLGADSQRSLAVDLDDPTLRPQGWQQAPRSNRVQAATDMVVYELHVRDFSSNDASVPAAWRGKYLAFSATDSNGMRHLRALAEAGITDVHLLPVFDFASVPEQGCSTPTPGGSAADASQQAAIEQSRAHDCYNWGYDPWHYSAPEGSYASDAGDGRRRVLEFRQMVLGLHRAGLRVGMDVVYNHTVASGQDPHSLLDRIVPGYYHRLSADGSVETSTCCANTASENAMMAKLIIDSVRVWARDYRIDSFRFDLMGHQPRALMETLQAELNAATGRQVQLIGEGWNFGEVADGARFVQASQLSLNGSGIGTFSDRARDAIRGGGCCDNGSALVTAQGYVNGLHYAANAPSHGLHSRDDLLRAADLVRVGLAGSLRSFSMTAYDDRLLSLEQIRYAGSQAAGYASEPAEVVNYVENHDNQTLFDINTLKLPQSTSPEERARVQMLAAAITLFSQGIAYFHAGIDTLRSKSLDRNSFDSGDWFNRIDWSYQDNNFAVGLPPASDNRVNWDLFGSRLADPAIKPSAPTIRWTRDAFRDLLRIRASSSLFRLRSAEQIRQRLRFPNSGSTQLASVLVGHLDGRGERGSGFAELIYLVNVDVVARQLHLPSEIGKRYVLHPVQQSASAADPRPRDLARWDAERGLFELPARSAVVFVLP